MEGEFSEDPFPLESNSRRIGPAEAAQVTLLLLGCSTQQVMLLVCLPQQHHIPGRRGTRIAHRPASYDLLICRSAGLPCITHSKLCIASGSVLRRSHQVRLQVSALMFGPSATGRGAWRERPASMLLWVSFELPADIMHASRPSLVVLLQDLLSFEESLEEPQLPSGDRDAHQQREDAEPRYPGVRCFVEIPHFGFSLFHEQHLIVYFFDGFF